MKTATTSTKKQQCTIQEKRDMRSRLAAIKPLLPNDWRAKLLEAHPVYATYSGFNKIDNVARGISTDPVIIEFLEKLVAPQLTKESKS